jgi:hypothetical protein
MDRGTEGAGVKYQVLNNRGMFISGHDTREDAEARVSEARASGIYGYYVIPPAGGYPKNLTRSDLENTDTGPDDDE